MPTLVVNDTDLEEFNHVKIDLKLTHATLFTEIWDHYKAGILKCKFCNNRMQFAKEDLDPEYLYYYCFKDNWKIRINRKTHQVEEEF